YRTSHNDIQISAVGQTLPVEGFDVAYNTGFDLGTSGSGECGFIETDVISDSVIQFNRAWRISQACYGLVAKPAGAEALFENNLYRGNYLQGAFFGIDLSTFDTIFPGSAVAGNYVTDSYMFAIQAWGVYGNAVRRWSEGTPQPGLDVRYAVFPVLA